MSRWSSWRRRTRSDKTAALVLRWAGEINGDHYEILTPAADALGNKHPLAATLLLRPMIEFSLKEGRVKRYRHAARHLAECASLAIAIESFGALETHDTYVVRMRDEHGQKLVLEPGALHLGVLPYRQACDRPRQQQGKTQAMPKAETFQSFMKRERTRLQKARDKAAQKKAEVDKELEALDRRQEPTSCTAK